MTTAEKIEKHKAFWKGQGPSLIFVPTGQTPLYDVEGYHERFYDPEKMWESEMERARPVLDWPTDGIATVRPNLGVIFIPALAGQDFEIRPGHMPWPGKPLEPEKIRTIRNIDVKQTEVMRLAEEFYRIHFTRAGPEVIAYQPDTQGIFDVAHLIYGKEIFYDVMYEQKQAWIDELLDISMDLIVRAAVHIKKLIGEQMHTMTHGHGTAQGVYFPDVGLRISEDAPIMLSPQLIDRFVIPPIERCAEKFGGIFMHYCGRHEYLFERLCRCEGVRALDLGNPELYDIRRIFEICAETNTVLYSRVAAGPQENWRQYVFRLGKLVRQTGACCILRPLVFPGVEPGQGHSYIFADAGSERAASHPPGTENLRRDCAEMQQMWHELTG